MSLSTLFRWASSSRFLRSVDELSDFLDEEREAVGGKVQFRQGMAAVRVLLRQEAQGTADLRQGQLMLAA
jgi:hypothetical protein